MLMELMYCDKNQPHKLVPWFVGLKSEFCRKFEPRPMFIFECGGINSERACFSGILETIMWIF